MSIRAGTTRSFQRPIQFTPSVGVAPGTLTFQLGAGKRIIQRMGYKQELRGTTIYDPYIDIIRLRGLGEIDTRARIRWDLIGLVGGGSALLALLAGLIASR